MLDRALDDTQRQPAVRHLYIALSESRTSISLRNDLSAESPHVPSFT